MADNNNAHKNPFAAAAESWGVMPNAMDWGAWRQQCAKNLETMHMAQHMALDYLKEAARKSADALQKSGKSAADLAQHAMGAHNLEDVRANQAKAAAMAMEHSMAHMNEAAEMWARMAGEMFSLCNKRFSECASECSKSSKK